MRIKCRRSLRFRPDGIRPRCRFWFWHFKDGWQGRWVRGWLNLYLRIFCIVHGIHSRFPPSCCSFWPHSISPLLAGEAETTTPPRHITELIHTYNPPRHAASHPRTRWKTMRILTFYSFYKQTTPNPSISGYCECRESFRISMYKHISICMCITRLYVLCYGK